MATQLDDLDTNGDIAALFDVGLMVLHDPVRVAIATGVAFKVAIEAAQTVNWQARRDMVDAIDGIISALREIAP